jgi:hypothetical protein
MQSAFATSTSTMPAPAVSDLASSSPAQASKNKSVLILSGTQYGLPVSDDLVASAVSTLKKKGISANDIYV